MKNIKKFILILIILIAISYIFMISYKINVFLSSESNISKKVFLELSKKGMSKEEINKLPNILANYIAKDKNLEKLTRSNNKNVSLVFSTQGDSKVTKQDNKISLDYFVRENIKFNPFTKDTILILMNLEESHESNNFLYVKGIDYLGRTKTYTNITMDHFSEQKYETGEVFIIPNLIIYKRFIICNPPRREMQGYYQNKKLYKIIFKIFRKTSFSLIKFSI